jgi:preprotein translocase subunit SecG
MSTLLMVLHILVCILLILVVLLQRGKGSDIGAALGGGGGNTVFGARGAGNFLTKVTTGAAITFMLTSLSLSYFTNQDADLLVFDEGEILEETTTPDALAPTETEEATEASADELVEIDPDGTSGDPE